MHYNEVGRITFMRIIDLTFSVTENNIHEPAGGAEYSCTEVALKSARSSYTGIIYDFSISSMDGTYIDFPGHIKETDNGDDAENYPVEKLYRRDATVIHLDRESDSGAVTAEELQAAFPSPSIKTPVLIVNALGKRRFDDIKMRSVTQLPCRLIGELTSINKKL